MFYCLFIVQSHKIVHLFSADFVDFLSAVFWAQNIQLPPFFILLTCTKSIFTNFWHLAPNFTNFTIYYCSQLFFTFYHFLSPFFTSHQLLPTFHHLSLTFTNLYYLFYYFSSIKNDFIFLFHLLTCTNPTILLIPCYKY